MEKAIHIKAVTYLNKNTDLPMLRVLPLIPQTFNTQVEPKQRARKTEKNIAARSCSYLYTFVALLKCVCLSFPWIFSSAQ